MVTRSAVILVVDDEPNMCDVLRRILEKEGYKVLTATDGETALRLTRKHKPDLMLLDLLMPGIDGREVCQRVREFYPATRVIYFSAMGELKGTLKAREIRGEADAVITKPSTANQIISMINIMLGNLFCK